MITDINSEDRLVQQTFADHLRDSLEMGDEMGVLKQLQAIPAGGTRARCSRPLWPTAGSRAWWN